MEAFSLGTPVLVSKNSGSSEIVMDKINGHKITNDQSKEELSELLVKISNNEFDIEQIGRNAKKYIMKNIPMNILKTIHIKYLYIQR